jgi:enoyl-CoA hydratase/carnithine racemase
MYKFIEVRKEENIGIITLNRPEKLNAWHKPMRDELIDALKNFESNQNIRAIILTWQETELFVLARTLKKQKPSIRIEPKNGSRNGGWYMVCSLAYLNRSSLP